MPGLLMRGIDELITNNLLVHAILAELLYQLNLPYFKELCMSRIMPDIFKELSFVEIAVQDAKHEPVITERAWLVVKDFILDQLKAINTELDQKSSPDYKQALRGMMNAFLRAHGCNERVDCAKYPEYEQALLAITAQPETSKPKAKTHEEMWAHLKSLPTPSAETLLSGGMMMYYVDACYDFMCKD